MAYKIMLGDEEYPSSLGKIVCIGRNYADHAAELNNPIPTEPILFIKPATAATAMAPDIAIPTGQGSCHIETEIAILIGKELCQSTETTAREAIAGVGIGFDLTLREVQAKLKQKGLPWEKAKAFDSSCPLSNFVTLKADQDLGDIGISLKLNHLMQQEGTSKQMLTSILPMLSYISQHFTLLPGDVVLTGTPAGVTALTPGDELVAELITSNNELSVATTVVAKV